MAAEILQDRIELYRFKEGGGNFSASCVLKYTNDTVEIKGLSGPIDLASWRELNLHLVSRGTLTLTYNIKGREVTRDVRKDTRVLK